MGYFIDAFTDAVEQLPPPHHRQQRLKRRKRLKTRNSVVVLSSSKKSTQGWLRTILFNAYFQMALRGLEHALFSHVSTEWCEYFDTTLYTTLHLKSSCICHSTVHSDWYSAMLGALQRVWWKLHRQHSQTLFSKEEAERFKLSFRRGEIQFINFYATFRVRMFWTSN